MIIKGVVTSGLGLGRKFMSMDVYRKLFRELLKKDPYPGTLNIKLINELDLNSLVNKCKPSLMNNIERNGRIYGGFIYWYGFIRFRNRSLRVIVLRPFRSKHDTKVLEVVSDIGLRKELMLHDNDIVTIKLMCGG